MKIAILGTGSVAQGLAAAWAAAGHEIVLGSRTPDAKSGLPAPVRLNAEAVAWSELVVNATSGDGASFLPTLGAEVWGSRVLLDVSNEIDAKFDLIYPNDSAARRIQQALPDVKVVKSLNTFSVATMVDPAKLAGPSTVFLSGNDAGAKAVVAGLLRELGWSDESQVDLGGIETARGVEAYFHLFFPILQKFGGPYLNIAVVPAA